MSAYLFYRKIMTSKNDISVKKCGYIAIVGRPNVGKSTLLNHLLKQKVTITSRKPQTTRNNVLGIKTEDAVQMIFIDTPGIHKGHAKALNRMMNRSAASALKDVDVIIFVVDKTHWTEEDDVVLQHVSQEKCPVIVAVNKLDQMADKEALLPHVTSIASKLPKAEIVPISALRNQNLENLEALIEKFLPENDHFFSEDQITNKTVRFMAAEIVREKIIRQIGAEVPHQIAVEIEEFKEQGKVTHISALILAEKEGQKRIIIGDKGDKLKAIGSQARQDIEKLLDTKVMLNLWVKVKSGWSDDERALKSLGLQEDDF
ncbi:GTPase Era [Thalassocella blandensis]|nr:GTPase Era [Thalassocella blandensis]